jgi:lipopolysaccharide cholinephosphotransferase
MRELDLNEVKKIQLRALDFFSAYCKNNNLTYSAYLGTLLGAIRHNGYIPWDDDIDLMMPRDDYNQLVNNFYDADDNFGLASIENSNNYYLPFAKIYYKKTLFLENIDFRCDELGVNIDIFPIDYSNSSPLNTLYLNFIYLLKKISLLKLLKIKARRSVFKNNILKISKIIIYPIKLKWLIICINYLAISTLKKDSHYRCKVGIYNNKEAYSLDLFDNIVSVPFEDTYVQCINNFDIVLNKLYGDYMLLPPISKRISTHNFRAFIL